MTAEGVAGRERLAQVAAGTGQARTPLLAVCGIVKHFPGTTALHEFDFDLRAGEVHALLGENGAGKSTFIKILAGVHSLDGGEITLSGAPFRTTGDASSKIAFIHQDLALVDSLSVRENIGHVSGFPRRFGLIDWKALERRATSILSALQADVDPNTLVSRLSQAQKSLVAIARSLATPGVRILVLDEPTASLSEVDVARLFRSMTRLKAEGVGMIFVSHRMDEVFRIADRVTVMRDGKRTLTAAVGEVTRDQLVEAIVGRTPGEASLESAPAGRSTTVLEVSEVVAGATGPCSFSVRAGEVLALVGLEGAGQRDVSRIFVGDVEVASGSITLGQAAYHRPTAKESIARGIGFVSAKREVESLAAGQSIRENLFINPSIPNRAASLWIRPSDERKDAFRLMTKFRVRAGDPETVVSALSGGNQQKVVLARWLDSGRRLHILEEPTAGVDVGAKAEIHKLLGRSLREGSAVLLVSSDFEEVCAIATRALVFHRGRIVQELERSDLSMTRLVRAATGLATTDREHA